MYVLTCPHRRETLGSHLPSRLPVLICQPFKQSVACLAIAWFTVLLAVPPTAPARRVIGHWYATDRSYFGGDRCGSTDTITLKLARARAFNVRAVAPKIGESLEETDHPGLLAAEVTDIVVSRKRGDRASVTWTAIGSRSVCPPQFTDGSWATATTTFRVTYETRERLYFPSRCAKPNYKPRGIVVACGDAGLYLTSMRWRSWNTTVAKGSGTAHANDCIPYCAAGHFHTYPIRVRLYRAGLCATTGVYVYRRMRLTYPGPKPRSPRSYSVPFPCRLYEP